jgi:hypothetical protein
VRESSLSRTLGQLFLRFFHVDPAIVVQATAMLVQPLSPHDMLASAISGQRHSQETLTSFEHIFGVCNSVSSR